MKLKKTFEVLEKTADIFELPGEAVAGLSRVTVTGTGRVHIENHRGLIGYEREEISVNGTRVIIKIKGEALELEAMSDLELVITGRIRSVEYIT